MKLPRRPQPVNATVLAQPSPRSSASSATPTPSARTSSRAFGGLGPETRPKVARRHSPTPTPAGSYALQKARASKPDATGRSSPPRSTTGSGATRSCASPSDRVAYTGGSPTSGSAARARRSGPCRSIPLPSGPWTPTSSSHRTATIGKLPCSSRPQARSAGRPLKDDGLYKLVSKYASLSVGPVDRIVHALRANGVTNALEHEADIARVQDWLGRAKVTTTRLYGRFERRPEDSPTFRVSYCPAEGTLGAPRVDVPTNLLYSQSWRTRCSCSPGFLTHQG